MLLVATFPTWTGSGFQTDGPEWESARPPFILHLHGGVCGRQVSVLGWSGRERNYGCRRSGRFARVVGGGDGVETGACISGEFELRLQPVELTEYRCDVDMEMYRLQNRLHNLDPP